MTDSVSNTDAAEPTGDGSMDQMEDAMDAMDSENRPEAAQTAEDPGEHAWSDEGEAEAFDAETEALRKEFDTLNDRHLRLAAEFNNYRRRVEHERTETWGRAQSELLGRFLDVLDDLQRVAALDLSNATVEAIMEGIDLVDRKFVRMLADAGAEVLDPVGERFDPETMEAMMRVPAESEDQEEMVAQVFQKGYTLKGQLVRPARVSVLKLG